MVSRFRAFRPDDGSDELKHFLMLQGKGESLIMSFYLLVIQVDQSWANSTVLDVLNFVPDYEECQTLCRVRMNNDLCKIHRK